MSANGWVWDAGYNQYRIWSPTEQCWVLQNGTRLRGSQPPQLPYSQAADTYSHTATAPQGITQPIPAQTTPDYDSEGLAAALERLNLQRAEQYGESSSKETTRSGASAPSDLVRRKRTVDEHGRTVLRGTKGKQEPLDKRFVRRPDPKKFFRPGRVFKLLWAEQPGDERSGVTIVSAETWRQKFAVKIRWFVVVREGIGCCSCLPIQTYSRRGVNNAHLRIQDHAIIFTGEDSPDLIEFEEPHRSIVAGIMQRPIRVEPTSRGARLDVLSRLNYRKVYTIEHKVKVFDFGKVHSRYEGLFLTSFNAVWNTPLNPQLDEAEDEDEDEDETVAGAHATINEEGEDEESDEE